jgi:hypothetical protein
VGGALARLDSNDARTAVALARLHQDCVLAKENLSLDTETVVPVFLPGRHFEIRLNRTTFEQMLRSPLEATIAALSRAVRSAGLTPADIDAVLLVGGSSRIPMVAETVTRDFGRPLLEGVHPVHVVALGAAALADVPAPAVQAAWVVPVDVACTAGRTAVSASDVRNGAGVRDPEPADPPMPTGGVPWFDADCTSDSGPATAVVDGTDTDGSAQIVDLPRFGTVGAEGRTEPRADHVSEAPTRLLRSPGLAPAGSGAWPAAGALGLPPTSPDDLVPRTARPVSPVPALDRRGLGAGIVLMTVGTVVAVLIFVLVLVLAP